MYTQQSWGSKKLPKVKFGDKLLSPTDRYRLPVVEKLPGDFFLPPSVPIIVVVPSM